MPDRSPTCYLVTSNAEHVAQMRRLAAEAREVLKLPLPDKFLGRKTAEPFSEADADDISLAPA